MVESIVKKISVSISKEAWAWWQENKWYKPSQALELDMRKKMKECQGGKK